MKTLRPVKLFPASFMSRLACRTRRRNHFEGKPAVRSFCKGSRADCNPQSFRRRPACGKADAWQPDHRSLQIFVLAKTSMDEAPGSDEASQMAQILA